MAAIRRAIVARLVVDGGFVVFDVRSFTPRQLPGMNSLIDAILLAILARVHAHPLRVSRSPVVYRRIIAAVDPGVIADARSDPACARNAARLIAARSPAVGIARTPPSPLKL